MSYLAGSSIASATQMASCGVWLGDIRFLEVKLSFSTSEAGDELTVIRRIVNSGYARASKSKNSTTK